MYSRLAQIGLPVRLLRRSTASIMGMCLALPILVANAHGANPPLPPASGVSIKRSWGRMPLYFVPNKGQMPARTDFSVSGQHERIDFDRTGVTFSLHQARGADRTPARPLGSPQALGRSSDYSRLSAAKQRAGKRGCAVRVGFRGARHTRPCAAVDLGTRFNYFSGPKNKWKTGVPAYGQLLYRNLWPGIDLAFGGTTEKLKYEFRVRPGADPAQIRLTYQGAKHVRVSSDGTLVAKTPYGDLVDEAPVSYQAVSHHTTPVQSGWHVRSTADGAEVSFRLGAYDHRRALVIDPATLVYCGYIGGSVADQATGIAVDGQGSAYVTGLTDPSPASGFPITNGPSTPGANGDSFVAKVSPDGTGLQYCSYIGGSNNQEAFAIAVDAAGSAYLTGWSASTPEQGFPVTVGPSLTFGSVIDAFVAKVNPAGTALEYCGYLAGAVSQGNAIAVDTAGSAYVMGVYGNASNIFVRKIRADGTGIDYDLGLGRASSSVGGGIAVDALGSAYVTGETISTPADGFPVAVGPTLTFSGVGFAAFVAKVLPDGSGFAYCGYLGGSASSVGLGVALDGSGSAYVTGYCGPTGGGTGLPVVVGPALTYAGGDYDAFVAKVAPDGSSLEYCGYIGGSGADVGMGIAIDGTGSAYVAGYTPGMGFPVTVGPSLAYGGGVRDGFIAKVKPDGSGLIACGYIGGSGDDAARAVALDSAGGVYVAGNTSSSPAGSFPVTAGPTLAYSGGGDAFVAKLAYAEQLPVVTVVATAPNASNNPVTPGIFTISRTGNVSSPLAVNLAVTGTAVPGTDYTALPVTATIPLGQAATTVSVNPLAGATSSVSLAVNLTIAAGTGYVVGSPGMDAVTISEPVPQVTVVATIPNASNTPVTTGLFTVSRSGNTLVPLTVSYAVSGNAIPGTQYTALSGAVTIPAGQGTTGVIVTPILGATALGPLTVTITLATSVDYSVAAPATATVHITEPAAAVLKVVATTPLASNSPVSHGVFTLTRTGNTGPALMVSYTVGGTAVPGTDYTALAASPIAFAAGQTSATVTVTPIAGATANTPPTVVLSLTSGGGYNTGTPNSATVTIREPHPVVVIGRATKGNAVWKTHRNGEIQVSRSQVSAKPLKVSYSLAGTAISGTDFRALPGNITIPKGKAFATVKVVALRTTSPTGSKSLALTLTAGPGYAVGNASTASIKISRGNPH